MVYRYWCGECGFKTSWGTESRGEQRQIEHYANRHPTIDPGGSVEARKNPSCSSGCLTFIAIAILLLLLAAACQR